MALSDFLRSKKAFGLKTVAVMLVALIGFVVLAVIVFPQLYASFRDVMGITKECKRPEYRMEQYMDDISDALRILGSLDWEEEGMVEIQIDADEFVIGIDQNLYDCFKEGHINDSEMSLYESYLLDEESVGDKIDRIAAERYPECADNPWGAFLCVSTKLYSEDPSALLSIVKDAKGAAGLSGRRIDTIYRDFIRSLAENCQVGSLKDLKLYVKMYKQRFGPSGMYYNSIGLYPQIYKDCVNINVLKGKLNQTQDKDDLKKIYEVIRRELDLAAAGHDPGFVLSTFKKARFTTLDFIFGDRNVASRSSAVTLHSSPFPIKESLSDEELEAIVIEYARIFEKFINKMQESINGLNSTVRGGSAAEKKMMEEEISDYICAGAAEIRAAAFLAYNLDIVKKSDAHRRLCQGEDEPADGREKFGLDRIPKEKLKFFEHATMVDSDTNEIKNCIEFKGMNPLDRSFCDTPKTI